MRVCVCVCVYVCLYVCIYVCVWGVRVCVCWCVTCAKMLLRCQANNPTQVV